MKQTAVEWLVEQICTDVEMYDEYGNVSHVEFWNAFRSCTDLSEYISVAKAMEKQEKSKYELFVGKVSCEIGLEKTIELLKEVNKAFDK